MNCPKCDAAVDPAAGECSRCGVILSKATAPAFRPPHSHFEPAPLPKPRASTSQVVAIVVVIVAVVFALQHRRRGGSSDTLPGWYADAPGYSRAMAEQSVNNRAVLVYFHADWCGWCKKLDADLFRTSAFSARYPSVIKVKVNAELSAGERSLASQYGVRGYPTVVVVRQGRPAAPIVGYAEPEAYMAQLDSLVN